MLVVHSDKQPNGDARALVHKTPHNGDDECWSIETVSVAGGVGYRFKKSQGRSKDTYLISQIQRVEGSYWVDVTSDMSAPVLWQIDGSASSGKFRLKADILFLMMNIAKGRKDHSPHSLISADI